MHISFPELSLSDSRLDVFEGCDTTRPPLISLFYENAGFNFFTDSTQIYLIPRATGPNPKADYCITWRCPSAGTTNVDNNEWISVFPCPATHQLNIAFPEYFPAKTLKVNLINSAGIIVFTVEENPSGKITTLNLPTGYHQVFIYYVHKFQTSFFLLKLSFPGKGRFYHLSLLDYSSCCGNGGNTHTGTRYLQQQVDTSFHC